MLTLHPPGFIETGSCDGPRLTRGQPSREAPGILMSEIQNQYVAEFELPFRNVLRYSKEISNNWDRLDENQRNSVRNSFDFIKNDPNDSNAQMNFEMQISDDEILPDKSAGVDNKDVAIMLLVAVCLISIVVAASR